MSYIYLNFSITSSTVVDNTDVEVFRHSYVIVTPFICLSLQNQMHVPDVMLCKKFQCYTSWNAFLAFFNTIKVMLVNQYCLHLASTAA